MQNTDFVTIHHYLKLVETSCKMKEVSCMSAKLLKHDFPYIWKYKMIIGMPIFIHKKLPFTKTYTAILKQLQLIESLTNFP